MTEKMIENRVKKLRELEARKKELEAEENRIREELKAVLEEKGVEEITTKNFSVRWTKVKSNRFDLSAFRKASPEIAQAFTKATETRRFSVA